MPRKTNHSISAQIEREVAFYDVDAYRIVWHGNYPKYFEEVRCALLEKIGYSYQAMESSGYFFPIVDLHIRYPKPLKFKQKIRITAWLKEWKNRLVIDYSIHDIETSERLTKGRTMQVAVRMPGEVTQFESPPMLIERVEQAFAREAAAV